MRVASVSYVSWILYSDSLLLAPKSTSPQPFRGGGLIAEKSIWAILTIHSFDHQ